METRTWLVRSTNTGVSAYVDAVGRIVGETSLDDAEVLVAGEDGTSGEVIRTTVRDLVPLAFNEFPSGSTSAGELKKP